LNRGTAAESLLVTRRVWMPASAGMMRRFGLHTRTRAKSMIQTAGIIAAGALLLWSMTGAAQELMHSPSFEDNGPGRSSTVLNGYLSRSAGEGHHPAVIFLHGCGGLLMGAMIEPGESDWAGELTRRADPPRICSSDGR